MEKKMTERWKEVIRFGIVGGIATLIQAAVYWLLVGWLAYAVANGGIYRQLHIQLCGLHALYLPCQIYGETWGRLCLLPSGELPPADGDACSVYFSRYGQTMGTDTDVCHLCASELYISTIFPERL